MSPTPTECKVHPSFQRPSRRQILTGGLTLAAASALPLVGAALAAETLPEGTPFSFDILTAQAQALADRPYVAPPGPEGFVSQIDYNLYRTIRFRAEMTRWQDNPGFRLQAFHTGWLFGEPVRLFDVADGHVREMTFGTADFDYGDQLRAILPADGALPGVAGFRLTYPLNQPDNHDEVVAFLGASYFRALGRGSVYGLSARGLALNTGTGLPEEFPRFSAFYIEQPSHMADEITFHAALNSESVTGAYRFVVRPGRATEIAVTARLFFRDAIDMVGVAPLTSMFLYDDKNRARFDDFRPRVHDSEGLVIQRTDGMQLWRPLNNPPRLADSWFAEPLGRFGLHQRTRNFAAYQDAEARYDRRPSLTVEPLGNWTGGAVRLLEIPTELESNDNIVAAYVPANPRAEAGQRQDWSYRLLWGDGDEIADPDLAQVVATRAGAEGISGDAAQPGTRKFVIDFAGGTLPADATVDDMSGVVAVSTVSDGASLVQMLQPMPEGGMWRLVLDVTAARNAVIELTAYLAGGGRRLSETWLYQWVTEA